MFECVLFDLDGTLTDPAEGITKCVQYALKSEGIDVPDRNTLLPFIGPPLADSFKSYYGFDEEGALRCLAKYRERFATIGLYENSLYDGISDMLSDLKRSGKKVLLATSKPQIYAAKILDHFNISACFDHVFGPELSGVHTSKSEIIALALSALSGTKKADIVMVGDRCFDIDGAHENGIEAIGVRYGYAKDGELEASGADYIVSSVPELHKLLQS